MRYALFYILSETRRKLISNKTLWPAAIKIKMKWVEAERHFKAGLVGHGAEFRDVIIV